MFHEFPVRMHQLAPPEANRPRCHLGNRWVRSDDSYALRFQRIQYINSCGHSDSPLVSGPPDGLLNFRSSGLQDDLRYDPPSGTLLQDSKTTGRQSVTNRDKESYNVTITS